MRQRTMALALATMMLGTAGSASAQSRGHDAGWWPWEGGAQETARTGDKKAQKAARARANDHDDDHDDDIGQTARRGNGPPFCRNGQGHPVHGQEWCERKGWTQANW